jgi:hypothetical protein
MSYIIYYIIYISYIVKYISYYIMYHMIHIYIKIHGTLFYDFINVIPLGKKNSGCCFINLLAPEFYI